MKMSEMVPRPTEGVADWLVACVGRLREGGGGQAGGGKSEGGETCERATGERGHAQQRMLRAGKVSSEGWVILGLMPPNARRYKYLDTLTTMFVVILLVSNLVAQKICMIGPLAVSGAVLLFPITYIFGDVFTEVYGFSASRRAIWLGTFGTALLYVIGTIVIALPGAPGWKNQQAFEVVFGFLPRIQTASLIAFWAGDFANSYTLARMKLWTEGKWLWTRTVGSTVVGQGVDTTLVITLTFAGKYPAMTPGQHDFDGVLPGRWRTRFWATPVTYWVVGRLKASEHADAFDRGENFNPFHLGTGDSLENPGVDVESI